MAKHRKLSLSKALYKPPGYCNRKNLIRPLAGRLACLKSLRNLRGISYENRRVLRHLNHQLKITMMLGLSSLGLLAVTPQLQGHTAIPYKISKKKSVSQSSGNSQNLWDQIANDFTLSRYSDTPEVKEQIRWYQNHPKELSNIASQAAPYLYYVHQEVKDKGLPGELALLPIIESSYDPFAYSHVGAAGLWQMMPGTGSDLGLKHSYWFDGRRDVVSSTQAALSYLSYLDNFFDDNWLLAIAAYNSGPGTVLNASKENKGHQHNTQFWSLHLPAATEEYVPRLLAIAAIIRNPEKYGVHLPDIPNEPYFAKVNIDKPMQLSEVAQLSNMSLDDVYSLNPGYNHLKTSPEGPSHLLIPVEKVQTFKDNMDAQGTTIKVQMPSPSKDKDTTAPKDTEVSPSQNTVITYRVHTGDTLNKIATHNHVSLKDLQAWNHLTAKSVLHKNQTLSLNDPNTISDTSKADTAIADPSTADTTKSDKASAQAATTDSAKSDITLAEVLSTDSSKSDATSTDPSTTDSSKSKAQDTAATADAAQKPSLAETEHSKKIAAAIATSYKVKSGDTLSSIAKKHKVSVDSLRHYNHLKSDHLKLGQVIKVPTKA